MSRAPRGRHRSMLHALAVLLLGSGCSPSVPLDDSGPTGDWPFWGGDQGASHYSALDQITPENVASLEVVWQHDSGDHFDGSGYSKVTSFQVTPLVANETLYYCTPFMRVFALDPETGEERWSFDPKFQDRHGEGPYPLICRGVSYWEDAQAAAGSPCRKRIFYGTADSELIALDADTGAPCPGFGERGRVGLREGIGDAPGWEYHPTSPPLIMRDRVLIGALVADNVRVDAPAGVVRAFDARTGRLVWAWDPVPPGWSGQPDPETGRRYAPGTPNIWSIMTGDAERGLVFVPTGNPAPDLYGGQRNGLDYYGSSTVALDIETGRVVWHFQAVHHDIWDFDSPSPPTLFQIPGVGGGVPGLAQPTKVGHIFLLNRETGEPLYPVEERPVPQGGVPGEKLSPTQPFPTHPPPLHPTEITKENVYGFTPIDRASCKKLVAEYRWDGPFTPNTLEGNIQFPHTSGGMNWGGVAIDPQRGILITNQTHAAQLVKLIPREEVGDLKPEDMAYPNEYYPMEGTPYGAKRLGFLSNFGAPCNAPPWGSLTAVDLRSGKVRWKIPFGSLRELAPFPVWALYDDMGSPNFGGGIATETGLFFIGATMDKGFRAYNTETGEEVWSTRLPYAANSVPMSFRFPGGKQYVVVASGGNPLGDMGSTLIAFALR